MMYPQKGLHKLRFPKQYSMTKSREQLNKGFLPKWQFLLQVITCYMSFFNMTFFFLFY